jgi:hypothetical protein
MLEVWASIQGFHGLYIVSNFGNVKSLSRRVKSPGGSRAVAGRNPTQVRDAQGYCYVCLSREGVVRKHAIHRLVALHFLPADTRPQVNHKDFDKANNHVNNLEWVTPKENQQHTAKTGRFHGANNPKRAKRLTPEIVALIRQQIFDGVSVKQIAASFSTTVSTIASIKHGRLWPL